MDVREKTESKKRLIDANKLIKNGIRVSYGFDNDGKLLIPMGDVIRSIKEAPTIDAVPVVHGRWIEPTRLYYGAKQYECSLCCSDTFWKKHSITEKYPCCPNCGCRMDGGDDE